MHPRPVRLRHKFRLLAVAMFLRVSKHAAYSDDDEAYYIDCLKGPTKESNQLEQGCDQMKEFVLESCHLTRVQQYGVYYVAGWVARKLYGSCDDCNRSLKTPEPDRSLPYEWTQAISAGGLIHPTGQLNEILSIAESLVKNAGTKGLQLDNVLERLEAEISQKIPPELYVLFCTKHGIVKDAIKKFLALRVHVLALNVSQPEVIVQFGSKSGFMRTSAQSAGKRKAPNPG